MEKLQKNIIYPKVTFWDISKAFWNGIRPYKWSLFFIIFIAIAINAISIASNLFYKQFFDVIAISGPKEMIAQKLLAIIVMIAGVNGIIWILYRSHAFLNTSFQNNVITKLQQQAYDYLMGHSYSFFTNNFSGSLVQKVNRFGRAFERMADRILWDILSLIVKVVSVIIIVSFINKFIALAILVWAISFLLFIIIFSTWKIKYDLKVAEIDSKATGYLADTIANQNVIQLFARAAFESKGYKQVTDSQSRAKKINWNLVALIEAGQSLLGFSIEFILFYYAIKYWQQGLVTVGFFVLLQTYVFGLIDQLWGFTRITRDIYQAYADAKEMVEIMKLPHEIVDVPKARELKVHLVRNSPPTGPSGAQGAGGVSNGVKDGRIQFKNLQFSFNETRQVLKDINLVIKPGERVALIGPSGAGKTTFVKLLLRLYIPTAGHILIDGQDISQVTQDSLRKNISMVPQDPILFHRTLAENIAYGKPDATLAQIKKAAKLAHCDEFIKNLPYGLETFVGERGIKLSGGERQRVAIARAILKNAPVLILDEATSSLDSHSEMLIQDALNTLMKGRTTIVIAHRLSTIQKMDRIIVIDDGKIIEDGSHADLLVRENSLYKKLWTLQAGGFLTNEDEEEEDNKQEEIEE